MSWMIQFTTQRTYIMCRPTSEELSRDDGKKIWSDAFHSDSTYLTVDSVWWKDVYHNVPVILIHRPTGQHTEHCAFQVEIRRALQIHLLERKPVCSCHGLSQTDWLAGQHELVENVHAPFAATSNRQLLCKRNSEYIFGKPKLASV